MRIAFMGTPDFAVPSLLALAEAGHEIAAVYSQPPRPAGRGHKERPSPVHAAAEQHGWPVRTPRTLKSEEEQAAFRALGLDAAVVVAYGLILPKSVLEAPLCGCLNVHASLLPRWRGAAPIQRAILAGDEVSGVTIMLMDEGLDTGAMLLQESVPITAETTGQSLHDELAALGAQLIVKGLQGGHGKAQPQPDEGITYADKLKREEAKLDWQRDSRALERQVRAFFPWPGAYFEIGGERIKVLAAEVTDGSGPPGQVLDAELTIACGEGALRPLRVQRAGKAPMETAALLRGFPAPPGKQLS